jgi:hypothetical protein
VNAAVSLLELPDEQLAPFSAPLEADVHMTRLEIERHKRRLNEATPQRPWTGEGRDL